VIAVIIVTAAQPPKESPVDETSVTDPVDEATDNNEEPTDPVQGVSIDLANKTKLQGIPDDYPVTDYY
jgi:hypothetical protein